MAADFQTPDFERPIRSTPGKALPLRTSGTAAVLEGPPRRLPDGLPGTIAACIGERVAEKPDGVLRSIDAATYRQTTFAELWDRAGRVAAGIAFHVAPDQPVVCIQNDYLDALTAFWACLRAGRTVIPFTGVAQALARADSTADPLAPLADSVLLIDAPTPAVEHLCRKRPGMRVLRLDAVETLGIGATLPLAQLGSRPACMMATSGSTGQVKLVALSDSALRHRYFSANYRRRDSDLHCLGLFPFDSITGLRSAFLNAEAWTQLAGRIVAGDPLRVLQCLADQHINSVIATNALAARMVDAALRAGFRGDLSSLSAFGLGGEAVTRPVTVRLQTLLRQCGADCEIQAGYGATETSPIVTGADPTVGPDDEGAVALGGCSAGMALRIVDDNGEILREGEVGDIEVKCSQLVFSGYADDSHPATFSADGWWRTGDLGEVRDGNLLFRGRRKDVIVVDGVKLSLTDIDLVLQAALGCPAHAAILRSAGDATDRLGIGVFRPLAEAPTDTIRDLIARRYGLSVAVVAPLEGDVVLTATGKVDRPRLAARLAALRQAMSIKAPNGKTVAEKVAAAWRTALGFEAAPTVDFFTAGGDSFSVVRLQLAWEEEFGTPFPVDAFRGAATQEAMAASATDPKPVLAATDRLERFERRQKQLLANWQGTRPTKSGLIIGRPIAAQAPRSHWQSLRALLSRRPVAAAPTFWLLQHGEELSLLQEATPVEVPVFGLGSGKTILDLDDPEALGEVVARYIQDIRDIQPNGPYRIGGACRGARLALALARTLQAAGETITLLTIVDANIRDLFQAPYGGKVALIIGRKSPANPLRLYAEPDHEMKTWAPNGFFFRLIDAGYAQVFLPERLAELRAVIAEAVAWARTGA